MAPLSDARLQQTILLYSRHGVNPTAERLGITQQAVRFRLDRAGVPRPFVGYRGVEAMDRREALRNRRRARPSGVARRERRDPLRTSRLVDEVEALG